ncbi:hypothetical protein LXL04_008556 [Taraxacum kok-saghyz]
MEVTNVRVSTDFRLRWWEEGLMLNYVLQNEEVLMMICTERYPYDVSSVAAMLSVEGTLLPGRSNHTDKKRNHHVSELPDGSGWADHKTSYRMNLTILLSGLKIPTYMFSLEFDAKVPKTPFSTCSDLENSIIALLEIFWPMY